MSRMMATFVAAIALVVIGSGVAVAVVGDGLIAYYTFDDVLTDTSGSPNVHNGTYSGDSSDTYVAAKFGNGIDLDGNSEHIQAADHADFDFGAGGTGMTISAWFKVNSFDTSWQALVAKGEGSEFRLHRSSGSNNLNWSANGDTTASYDVNDGALHHVVVTHDGASSNSTKALWIDGLLRSNVTNGGQIADNNQPLMIGENPDAGGREWEGVVDDVGLWNRPLSGGEILAIWNGGTGATIQSVKNVAVALSPTPGLNVELFNVISGGGSNDNDLNDTNETKAIWDFLDANPGFTGTTPSLSGKIYNVENNVPDTETKVDYGGGGGNFGGTLAYNTINNDGPGGGPGPINGGDDFSVKAHAYLDIPQGDWSIMAASDDGRYLRLDDVIFNGQGGQINLGGTGNNFIGFNGTTGHNNTVGTFTIGAGGLQTQLYSFFFERASGDSFEIAIRQGLDTSMGGPGEGWAMLGDGVFGWLVSSEPFSESIIIPEPTTFLIWSLLAGLGVGLGWRRRK